MNNKEVNTDSIAPVDKLMVYGFEEIEELTREEKQEILVWWFSRNK